MTSQATEGAPGRKSRIYRCRKCTDRLKVDVLKKDCSCNASKRVRLDEPAPPPANSGIPEASSVLPDAPDQMLQSLRSDLISKLPMTSVAAAVDSSTAKQAVVTCEPLIPAPALPPASHSPLADDASFMANLDPALFGVVANPSANPASHAVQTSDLTSTSADNARDIPVQPPPQDLNDNGIGPPTGVPVLSRPLLPNHITNTVVEEAETPATCQQKPSKQVPKKRGRPRLPGANKKEEAGALDDLSDEGGKEGIPQSGRASRESIDAIEAKVRLSNKPFKSVESLARGQKSELGTARRSSKVATARMAASGAHRHGLLTMIITITPDHAYAGSLKTTAEFTEPGCFNVYYTPSLRGHALYEPCQIAVKQLRKAVDSHFQNEDAQKVALRHENQLQQQELQKHEEKIAQINAVNAADDDTFQHRLDVYLSNN